MVLESFLGSGLFDFVFMCNIGGKRTGVDFEYIRNLQEKYSDIPIIIQLFGGFREKKLLFSKEFEQVNSDYYIPVVYDMRRTMKIIFKMVKSREEIDAF